MTPQTYPIQPITVDMGDGVSRRLRFSIGSNKRLLEKIGRSLTSLSTEPDAILNHAADLLHEAFVSDEDRAAWPVEKIDALPLSDISEIIKAVSAALEQSAPEKNVTGGVRVIERPSQTGSNSGVSPDTTSA